MDKTIHVLGHMRHSHVCQILLQLAGGFFPIFFPVSVGLNKRYYSLYQPCLTLFCFKMLPFASNQKKKLRQIKRFLKIFLGEMLMMKIVSMVYKEIICTKSALCSWTPAFLLLDTPGVLLDLYPLRRQHLSEQELEAQRENQLEFRLIHFPWSLSWKAPSSWAQTLEYFVHLGKPVIEPILHFAFGSLKHPQGSSMITSVWVISAALNRNAWIFPLLDQQNW